ncbi:hypothetical protein [Enterococcus songbeiensis]
MSKVSISGYERGGSQPRPRNVVLLQSFK